MDSSNCEVALPARPSPNSPPPAKAESAVALSGTDTEAATPDSMAPLVSVGDTSETVTPGACRRVSFAPDSPEVHEFVRSEAEMEAEKHWLEAESKRQADAFEEMKQRWAAKAADPKEEAVIPDPEDPDGFRHYRTVRLHRGKALKPLGLDLAVKEAATPDTGTVAVVREVKRGFEAGVAARSGRGDASLRCGDRIVRVWDTHMSKCQTGQFLALLAAPSLELRVFNEIDEAARRADAARAAEAAQQREAEEEAERQRQAAELAETEEKVMQLWLADAKRREASLGQAPQYGNVVDRSLFRSVSIDRRPEAASRTDFGLAKDANDRAEYFEPREPADLRVLGISLFTRVNRDKAGKECGTFAVINRVDNVGAVVEAGFGHNMIWADDQIIRVQGRDFRSLTEKEFIRMMRCRRLQLVLCNVDEYAAATRDPDFIDDLGRHLGNAMGRIDALATKLKSAWHGQVDGFFAKVRDTTRRVSAVRGGRRRAATPAAAGVGDVAPMPDQPALLHETSPLVEGLSDILRPRHWCALWSEIPRRIRYKEARLMYTSAKDGYSMQHFLHQTAGLAPSLFIIRTRGGGIMGAYITTPFVESGDSIDAAASEYRGTNEMFVFQVEPTFAVYRWAGLDHADESVVRMFLNVSRERIAIGGGGESHAIALDEDFRQGLTGRCATFDNAPLCSTPNFECSAIELWSFTENVNI